MNSFSKIIPVLRSKIIEIDRSVNQIFFPEQNIYARNFPIYQSALLLLFFTFLFSLVGKILPANGFIGFDWVNFFGIGNIPPFYPPWTKFVVGLINWQLLIGLTLAGFAYAVIRRGIHPLSIIITFFCLPLFWTLFLGQLEALVLFGFIGIPWLAPLILLKPQVSFFSFFEKKKWLLVLLVFLVFTVLIYGFWPEIMFNVESYYQEGRYPQNIGIGFYGLPLALVMLWLSRGDMDMLMLAGTFAVSHIIPYNMLPFIPAVARLKPKQALIAAILSWLPFSANWIGPIGWWLGWLLPAWIWAHLALRRYPESKITIWFTKAFRMLM